jgi:hypothetical protein
MRILSLTQTSESPARLSGAPICTLVTINAFRYSHNEVAVFMKDMVDWMEQQSWLLAYSWHDSEVGSSALVGSDGELTDTGKLYAAL